jgi:hypothetical protein
VKKSRTNSHRGNRGHAGDRQSPLRVLEVLCDKNAKEKSSGILTTSLLHFIWLFLRSAVSLS